MKVPNRSLQKAEWEKVIQEEGKTSLSKAHCLQYLDLSKLDHKIFFEILKTFERANDKHDSRSLVVEHKHLNNAPSEINSILSS